MKQAHIQLFHFQSKECLTFSSLLWMHKQSQKRLGNYGADTNAKMDNGRTSL